MPIERFREELALLTAVEDKLSLLKSQFSLDPFQLDLSLSS